MAAFQTLLGLGSARKPTYYATIRGAKDLSSIGVKRKPNIAKAQHIGACYQNRIAYITPLEHQELVLTLGEEARKKILAKTRKLRRHLAEQLNRPRLL